MNATIVSAVIRHLLTAVGGGFAVKWGIDGGTMDAVIGGASALGGLIWSIAEKRKREDHPGF